eukprot:Sspe_Gene.76031::Locus_47503_Transcript_1_1_Confidence_1.000_Length_2285::g.76031::m.76031/K20294/COG7; conserved oligomeric Golgi complex subunit 7
MEYQAFQEDGFDPKKWLNDTLRTVPRDELEGHVNQLQTKLQFFITEVNGSFEDHIMQSLARLTRCHMELDRMSREVSQLTQSMNSLLTPEVLAKQHEAEKSIGAIAALHETKTKLDKCMTTLSQTVYLRENMHRMDSAFSKGDTTAIAAEIAAMQQALQAIQGFDHHHELAGNIERYEAKLQQMVERECVEALVEKDIAKAQRHLETLRKIDREHQVLEHYAQQAIAPLEEEWAKFEEACTKAPAGEVEEAFLHFLPSFNSTVQGWLTKNSRYFHEVFQERAKDIALQCFTMALQRVAHSQQKYLSGLSLQSLVAAYCHTTDLSHFATTEVFQNVPPEKVRLVEAACVGPYTSLQADYAALEKKHLIRLISRFGFVVSGQDAVLAISPSLVNGIGESSNELLMECQDAAERCYSFTHGIEYPALIVTLNDAISEFSRKTMHVVKQLRSALSLGPGHEGRTEGPFAAEEPLKVKLSLQLHATATGLSERVELFQAWTKEKVLSHKQEAMKAMDRGGVAREKREALTTLFSELEGVGVPLYAPAMKELSALAKAIESLVFDVLFDPIRARFVSISTLPAWNDEAAPGMTHRMSTSTPLEYLRLVGDYILEIPDILLQAAPGDSSAVQEDVTDFWLPTLLRRTVDLFINQVEKIPSLSEAGTEQLSTDTEYLDNILQAFSDEGAAVLKVVYLLVSTPADAYPDQLKAVHGMDPRAPQLFTGLAAKRGDSLGVTSPPTPLPLWR